MTCDKSSNNTNKLSPQEPIYKPLMYQFGSNNTNKLSPQELPLESYKKKWGSNNTNKLSPQEHTSPRFLKLIVQIIQINLVLKNCLARITL